VWSTYPIETDADISIIENMMTCKPISFTNRDTLWQELKQSPNNYWDVVIVGGGIIGAGVLREASRRGLNVLLIEQQDFAWGTSSRSSKMVHGGLRYIAQGDIKLTKHSVQERERLLKEAPGLVERVGNYFLLQKRQFPGRIAMGSVLTIYDKLAGIKDHRYLDKNSLIEHFPNIQSEGLKGACYYSDTSVDDARLVLRVLQESIQNGGKVLNYVQAKNLITDSHNSNQVSGLVLENIESGEQLEVKTSVVVNATGAWADRLRQQVVDEKRIRPLRGSHLVFASKQLPLKDTLILFHPKDKRPVFIFPWEGATLVGTTDLDHHENLDLESTITQEEVEYLLQVVSRYFPNSNISHHDVISSYSGVRPVIGSDRSKDPSKERRDHAVWADKGLVTVSGGKLTTFRLTAIDTLNMAQTWLRKKAPLNCGDQVFITPPISEGTPVNEQNWLKRITGRYGFNAQHIVANASDGELLLIAETQFSLAECRWAIKHESVVHLDDLLLRRTRLGILVKNGAQALFPILEKTFQEELGWDNNKWTQEVARYQSIWKKHYSLPSN